MNGFVLPELNIEDTISVSTSVRWMKKLGFALCRVQKGVYVDGHERKDVVLDREKYIEIMQNEILPSVLPLSFFECRH